MNSNTTIHISQVPSQFSAPHVRLSHKQQLELGNRCERRILRITEQRLSPKQRAARRFKRSEQPQRWRFIEKLLKSFTPLKQVIMNKLLEFGETFDVIKASSQTIARLVGCHRNTVQQVFDTLRRHGLLVLNRRRWNNSSARRLHPDFFNPNLKLRLWKTFEVYRDYFQNANSYLKIWLTLQKECAIKLSTYNLSRFSKEDIHLYENVTSNSRELNITSPEVSNIQSREMYISLNEESHLLRARKSDITSRELSQEDNHVRDEVLMDPQELSQKIAEMRKSLEPQRAAQRALKAKSAGEISELLKGRITETLHLSAKGQFYLMRFSDGALLYGLENLAHHGTVDNQMNFRLFESACIEYSRMNEIEIESDRYDNLLKKLGYMESQPLCKKILLESPLAQKRVALTEPKKVEPAANYQPRERVIKPPENSGQVAVDSFLQDVFSAFATKLGYTDRLPDLPQIPTQSVDND
jgi:hypothetical protein